MSEQREQLTIEDLTPRERVVFVATCQLSRAEDDGREPLFYDLGYAAEAERLADLGWLDRVESEGELTGYRLSFAGAAAHNLQLLIEEAQASTN